MSIYRVMFQCFRNMGVPVLQVREPQEPWLMPNKVTRTRMADRYVGLPMFDQNRTNERRNCHSVFDP